ncbi:MAG: lipopolysaccharide heptosyltransferase II, partial [Rhizobiales bacterium]|nr:lipopolysaccharide heptosyltransferase II [Hyphomicrobiales bacterium]
MDARVGDSLNELYGDAGETTPILVVPYMWIGDFVRCHTVVRMLRERWPLRPVDVVSTTLTAALTEFMPGIRKTIVADVPHRRLAVRTQMELVRRMRKEHYGTALVMSRKWKAALAPMLAGVPERVGFFGEARLFLINTFRRGERHLPRLIDKCAALALPAGAVPPADLPAPQLDVPLAEVAAWRQRRGLSGGRRIVALAPGSVGSSKRWPAAHYAALAAELAREGADVWVIGGPGERELAHEIGVASGGATKDLTGPNLRDGILALRASNLAVSNDSGLLHVAAAVGTPTIGIFGPTSA